MATKKKTAEVDYSMYEKIVALYELQKIDSQIDEINKIKGELPLEVQDLEDEIAGLETRIANILNDIDELTRNIKIKKEEIEKAKAFVKLVEDQKVDFQSMYVVQNKYSDSKGNYVGRLKNVRDRWVKQGMDLDTANAYTLFAMSLYESPQNRIIEKEQRTREDLEDIIFFIASPPR